MKKSVIFIFSCLLTGFTVVNAQTNNSNTSSYPQAPAGNSTVPQQNNGAQPLPGSKGTEPNNRVMLKSQTDSMDSKRGSKPTNIHVTSDTIGTDRSRMRNQNPVVHPTRRDSIR